MERNDVRRAWNAVADDYAARRRADGEDAALIDELLAGLPANPRPRVLDIGCGDGSRTLNNLVGDTDTVGLDFSRRQLELAGRTAPDARLLQADMTALPVADAVFDGITAYHAVFHVSRTSHPEVYDEFARVLKSGGRLLMTVGTGSNDATRRNWLNSGHAMYWSTPGRETTVEQLDDAGFDIVWERFVDDPLGSQALFVLAERR